jgi:hypothetical protein
MFEYGLSYAEAVYLLFGGVCLALLVMIVALAGIWYQIRQVKKRLND